MGQTQNIEQQIRFLSNLQLGFGIAALLFLALAIFLFFYLHIPQVFNEYRGKSAQKAMEERQLTAATPDVSFLWIKSPKTRKKEPDSWYRDVTIQTILPMTSAAG